MTDKELLALIDQAKRESWTELDLSYMSSDNYLGELPKWIGQLPELQPLDVRSNNLNALPQWMAENGVLPRIKTLAIAKNPLTEPPAEVLGYALTEDYMPADVDAIRSYFRQVQEEGQTHFFEAKLLIIGEGGAGKTSLARKLVEPDCALLLDEESTEGIEIFDWRFDLPETVDDSDDYTVNVWDFGGQEIYFATHQFFLTKRSVYLLVADTRNQHTDFYNWLRMQETFGEGSPVLLAKIAIGDAATHFQSKTCHSCENDLPICGRLSKSISTMCRWTAAGRTYSSMWRNTCWTCPTSVSTEAAAELIRLRPCQRSDRWPCTHPLVSATISLDRSSNNIMCWAAVFVSNPFTPGKGIDDNLDGIPAISCTVERFRATATGTDFAIHW